VDLGEDTHHTTFSHLSCPIAFLSARAATAMGRGGPKTKAGKGEGVVADRTRHNGNKRGIAALQSKFVPPAQAKAKAGVGLPKPAFDSGSSAGAKEGQARSSPSPSKKKKKRQSKSPMIDAEAMKELLSTTKLFSSPSKQKEFQKKVKRDPERPWQLPPRFFRRKHAHCLSSSAHDAQEAPAGGQETGYPRHRCC
jgi:hypothetical protein